MFQGGVIPVLGCRLRTLRGNFLAKADKFGCALIGRIMRRGSGWRSQHLLGTAGPVLACPWAWLWALRLLGHPAQPCAHMGSDPCGFTFWVTNLIGTKQFHGIQQKRWERRCVGSVFESWLCSFLEVYIRRPQH